MATVRMRGWKAKSFSAPLTKLLKVDNESDLESKLAKIKEGLINLIVSNSINEVAFQRMIVDKSKNTIPKAVLDAQLVQVQNAVQVAQKQLEVVENWLHELGSKL